MGKQDLSTVPIDGLIEREWLATNQLGGYASSTLPSLNSRKYHGLLVAAMSPPVRQMVILSRVEETVLCDGHSFPLACSEYPGVIFSEGRSNLRAFSHEPFPRWGYQADGWTIEKELHLLRGENTVCLSYTLLGGHRTVELELRPMLALREIHELTYQWNGRLFAEQVGKAGAVGGGTLHRVPATNRTPESFFAHDGRFGSQPLWYLNTIYRRERERGYAGLEDVWTPGVIRWTMEPGQTVHFICSTDPIDLNRVVSECARQERPLAIRDALPAVAEMLPDAAIETLVRAADQFVVKGRDTSTGVMCGYPWAPPSGRDAMITLPGLLLVTGRLNEAKSLLQHYATLVDGGLMPSQIPTDGSSPRYEAADTSLWFINAVWQYLRYGGDSAFIERVLLPVVNEILRQYRAGTKLGISVDAEGLITSRLAGVPTSWMDAKTIDCVVTPRSGRQVELNALWYNAHRIVAELSRHAGHAERAQELHEQADQTRTAFNQRFWNERTGCCNDVVDDQAVDASIRPNQLFALSLPFPVLEIKYHVSALDKITASLLKPLGLRSLSTDHAQYQGVYAGNIVARDMAHHQGSIFSWLLGPYVTAMLRVRGRGKSVRAEAGKLLEACLAYMNDTGLGQLCELFSGNAPHQPGGLPASARSVAELLRCYIEDVLDVAPTARATAEPMGEVTVRGMKITNPN